MGQFDEARYPRARSGDADSGDSGEEEIPKASGMSSPPEDAPRESSVGDGPLPWDQLSSDLQEVLLSAAGLQEVVHHAVLVGGSVAALYAGHRSSYDHDHVLADLKERYDAITKRLEHLHGWKFDKRVTKPPMTVMGSLGDIEAGVRQLRRKVPLETTQVLLPSGQELTVPTLRETLRIKAFLIVQRNQVRDYLDVAALSDRIGIAEAARTLLNIDRYYPEFGDDAEDASTQVFLHLTQPQPKDTRTLTQLSRYKGLAQYWQDWNAVERTCMQVAMEMAKGR